MTLCTLSLLLVANANSQIRVDGEGYLRLVREGRVVFARSGSLTVSAGKLALEGGATFLPAISYSGDVSQLEIGLDGTVSAHGAKLGQIVLGVFASQPSQQPSGFYASPERPSLANPGEGATGVIRFGEGKAAVLAASKPQPQPSATLKQEPVVKEPLANAESVAVPVPPTSGVGIGIRRQSQVQTDYFTLGQIAVLKGDSKLIQMLQTIEIGDTPAVGVLRRLDLARINARLRGAGIDLNRVRIGLPENATVTRAGQIVTDADFEATAVQALEEKFGRYGTLKLDRGQGSLTVPIGERSLRLEDATPNAQGFRVTVAVLVDGTVVNRRTIALLRSGVPDPLRVGMNVKVLVLAGNAAIEVSGRVSRVGKPGEPVEVTLTGGKKLTGTQSGPDSVEVKA